MFDVIIQKLACYKAGYSSFEFDVPSKDLMMVRGQITGTH